jgi:putative ABC transport system permease protein
MMQTLWQDLRYGARMLLKQPGFTLIAIVTLSLGIGANTALFSLINTVLLRPLPFKDPDQLVVVCERRASSGAANLTVSGHEFLGWREQNHVFDKVVVYNGAILNLTGGSDPEAIEALTVSTDYFPALGVKPLLGRTFLPDEDQQGGAHVAVLSHKFWKQHFGADPALVGRTITLNDKSYTVVGVMPPSEAQFAPALWVPINLEQVRQRVGAHSLQVFARLKPGVTLAQAQADMNVVARRLEQQYPDDNVGHDVFIQPLRAQVVGEAGNALWVLFGAVGFVLLIACANVANLLLTRAETRQKELAIRAALGAGRARLMRQLLVESLLLAVAGGGLGLLLTLWITDLLPKLKAVNLPRLDQLSVDWRVLAATAGFSILTGLLTGLLPAWRASRPSLTAWLNEGISPSVSRRRLGGLLVVFEVALALVLLIGAGLMTKSFKRLMDVDPGFNPQNVLTMDLELPTVRYPQPVQRKQFYDQLLERLSALPGVQAVGASTDIPLDGGDSWMAVNVEGRPTPPPGQTPQAAYRIISPDYFRALQIPLRRGRMFNAADARVALPLIRWYPQQPNPPQFDAPQAAPAVIINETMARQFWPNEDPVGRRLKLLFSPWLTVVGVVADVHHTALDRRPNPEVFLPYSQEPQAFLTVVVRTSNDPLSLASAVREQVKAVDKDQPVTITTMAEVFANSVGRRRFNTLLLGTFGGLALLLAVVGVFGVVNYSVAQRTREIGVRMALGAQQRDIVKLVVGRGMRLTLLGVVIGLAASLVLTRLIADWLYGVSPTDAVTLLVVSLLLAGAALLACWIPARRAMKVDPLIALRYE